MTLCGSAKVYVCPLGTTLLKSGQRDTLIAFSQHNTLSRSFLLYQFAKIPERGMNLRWNIVRLSACQALHCSFVHAAFRANSSCWSMSRNKE